MYNTFQDCQKTLNNIKPIDFYLAKHLSQSILGNHPNELLFHSIIAVSQALQEGHTCLKLTAQAGSFQWQNSEKDLSGFQMPLLINWQEYLSDIDIGPEHDHPLVYENNRLYLRRYWQFENELALAIKQMVVHRVPLNVQQGKEIIDGLFPRAVDSQAANSQAFDSLKKDSQKNSKLTPDLDWQKIAVANALGRKFTIIAGGPGTGKTFTVTKLLVALQTLFNNSLRIAMVAPTGKAAQRLNESIQNAKAKLLHNPSISKDALNSLPSSAGTLHRLLGVKTGSHNFRYHRDRVLALDVVLIDEISMIDLPLMTRLIRALDPQCRLVMLGDADQLPSVAAGSVLADLAPPQTLGHSTENAHMLAELTGLDVPILKKSNGNYVLDYLTTLQKSRRFESGGEIGQLAKHVIAGNATSSWQMLLQGKQEIEYRRPGSMLEWISELVEEYYVLLFSDANNTVTPSAHNSSVVDIFEKLNQFRILVATRQGAQGVEQINESIELELRRRGLITRTGDNYPGRPIMITQNHYSLGLYNGDTGILWPNSMGTLMAAFPQTAQTDKTKNTEPVRWLGLSRLPRVDTVYAMTIHKTQGSEFKHVALILPETANKNLSRELLYTGITRASKRLSVWADKKVWETGVKRKIARYSGLTHKVFSK